MASADAVGAGEADELRDRLSSSSATTAEPIQPDAPVTNVRMG